MQVIEWVEDIFFGVAVNAQFWAKQLRCASLKQPRSDERGRRS